MVRLLVIVPHCCHLVQSFSRFITITLPLAALLLAAQLILTAPAFRFLAHLLPRSCPEGTDSPQHGTSMNGDGEDPSVEQEVLRPSMEGASHLTTTIRDKAHIPKAPRPLMGMRHA